MCKPRARYRLICQFNTELQFVYFIAEGNEIYRTKNKKRI